MEDELETFETFAHPESIAPRKEYEGSNAVRFAFMASLGLRSEDREREQGVAESYLENFGLNPEILNRYPEELLEQRMYNEAQFFINNFIWVSSSEEIRFAAFRMLGEDAQIDARLTFLVSGLASSLERESATAASAILSLIPEPTRWESGLMLRNSPYQRLFNLGLVPHFRSISSYDVSPPDADGYLEIPFEWDGRSWERYCLFWLNSIVRRISDPTELLATIRQVAELRVGLGQRSEDLVTRELSFASYLARANSETKLLPVVPLIAEGPATGHVSTMVHGTWGWKGEWWYPNGDFHHYVALNYRSDLYGEGQEFAWSGAYSEKQRNMGGERFKRWVLKAGNFGLRTVFAHSYGAEIVARAVNAGCRIDEAVFLSAPIHHHHRQMLQSVRRVIDVRLKFDIVLLAAGAGQCLPHATNVSEFKIDQNFWSHGATHNPKVWDHYGIASAVGL